MNGQAIKVLLVEDDIDFAFILRNFLNKVGKISLEWAHAQTLNQALGMVSEEDFDVILLDLILPDQRGGETFTIMQENAPDMAILVLTGLDDEDLGIQAVQNGAQDYLVKGAIDNKQLLRALRYAVERQKTRKTLQRLALIDDLTGIYNRRGFFALADQHIKLAKRSNAELLLLFFDVDKLKDINDSFGHHEGDQALVKTAQILADTFRASDIVARLGGDEFVVLAINASDENVNQFKERIQTKLNKDYPEAHPYRLSLSIGILRVDPKEEISIEGMIVRADESLYEEKRQKSTQFGG